MELDLISLMTPIVIAAVGGIWTVSQCLVQRSVNRSNLYIEFHKEFKNIQSQLPADINKTDGSGRYCYKPREEDLLKYERTLELYWWLVFDQWYICCRQCRGCRSLWKNVFSVGAVSALEREDWKNVLMRLVEGKDEFFGFEPQFLKAIDKQYYRKHRKHLPVA